MGYNLVNLHKRKTEDMYFEAIKQSKRVDAI